MQGYIDTGIQGYRDAFIQGYIETGIQGYRDAFIQGTGGTGPNTPRPRDIWIQINMDPYFSECTYTYSLIHRYKQINGYS